MTTQAEARIAEIRRCHLHDAWSSAGCFLCFLLAQLDAATARAEKAEQACDVLANKLRWLCDCVERKGEYLTSGNAAHSAGQLRCLARDARDALTKAGVEK